MNSLAQLSADLQRAAVRVVDLTQTLSPDFPALQLPPQLNVADKHDMSPMQDSQVSAACLTLGSLAARVRQLLRQWSTSYDES